MMMKKIDPPFGVIKIYFYAKPSFVFAPVEHLVGITKQKLRNVNRNTGLAQHRHYRQAAHSKILFHYQVNFILLSSRFTSFSLMLSRLSWVFFPRPMAISSLARPRSLINNRVGIRVNPFSSTFASNLLNSDFFKRSFRSRAAS